jgi:3-hydroxymyristoyl/3-hydroxydecanoyl-(acyl carrier protein) dehydratase
MPAEGLTARFRVDPSHPALEGHFPGNPIVPAVLLVRFVAQALQQAGHRLAGIERMKFLRPVRPGETIDVAMRMLPGTRGAVEISIDGEVVASGTWLSSPD